MLDRALGEADVRRFLVGGQRVLVDHVLQVQPLAQHPELVDRHLLDLVGGVATLDVGAERPALDRLGQDHRGRPPLLGGGLVRRVELAVVVTAAGQVADLVVGQVLDHLAQPDVGPEEVLAGVGPGLDGVPLELAVDGAVHPVEQDAVLVAGEQLVPLAAPDDLDDVPPRPAEHRLELLDDLPVAPDRAVEPLQVAVDDPGQVVELVAGGQREGAERLGLVDLAVADEAPHAGAAGVVDATVVQVPQVAGVVDRVQRAEPHRHRGVLPELGHEPRVRVAGQAAPHLLPELVEVRFGETALEERAGVDAGGGVALEVDGVARQPVVLAAEEVVEPDVVERGGRRERRQVAADAVGVLVGLDDHHRRVPADVGPDAPLERLVAREPRFLLGRDGVDVRRGHRGGMADLQLAGAFEQLGHEVAGAGLAVGVDDGVERLQPLLGLGRVGVGKLVHEPVDDHAPTLAPNVVDRNVRWMTRTFRGSGRTDAGSGPRGPRTGGVV